MNRPKHRVSLAVWLLAVLLPAVAAGASRGRPWQRRYTGDEATGKHVLALWHFDEGDGTRDASRHGHDLTLRGKARVVKGGRFGSCLESFPAGPKNDKPQGALTARRSDALSPAGAFTAELWLRPKPEMAKTSTAFLLDNKYYHYPKDLPQANAGYVLTLNRRGSLWVPTVMLGFGKDSEVFAAKPVALEPGTWYHLAFTYDGAGSARVLLNGQDIGGSTAPGRRNIAKARYALAIGDRYGSIHHGFAGYIDQVRITRGVTLGGLSIEVGTDDGRTAFVRMHKGVRLKVRLRNHTATPMTDVKATVSLGATRKLAFPRLEPRESREVDVPFDTSRRPDSYELRLVASARATTRTFECEKALPIVIVARPLPHRMPVVMWGHGDFEQLKAIGFTHHFANVVDYRSVWEAGAPVGPERYAGLGRIRESLNEHLAQGIGVASHVSPGRFLAKDLKYRRLDRSGQPYKRPTVDASLPKVQQFAYNVGASVARAVGSFPAFQAALIHTEVRDHTNLSFRKHNLEAFRKHAGYPVPRLVTSRACPRYDSIPGFPKDRIVPDDYPLLAFYRWFWKEGDGWNPLHTQTSKGLHVTGRDDLWTFFDPAVRVPSVWGSGGTVDVISHWTYSYPDPIKIGQATDELFAMADGAPGQRVMKMTQIIWYRSQTAPDLPKDPARRAQWEKDIPDARFITIAPDHLREALWSKISRPIQGIMYHGWGSLVGAAHGSYRHTNPKTKDVLAELIRTVVRPLGPTLVQVPDRSADVALLESFASQMLARRGSRGWSASWEADLHLILQWAQLQPRILYDEAILRDGLDGYRVLVMPNCDVLTASVARKIAAFQRKGGLLVADENLTPALKPDIRIQSHKRTREADKDKAALQRKAAEVRRKLDASYERYGESSDPDVVVRFRRYGAADYLFALNDKRTFGRYVGHHGLVMEKGLPNAATLRIRRKGGHVYDLVAHRQVAAKSSGRGLELAADFGPGGGRLFLITERPIADVRLDAPERARLGESARLSIAVVDGTGRPIAAILPLQVEILDPRNRPAERSGYYGAKDGRLVLTLDLATNDLAGQWTLRVTDLAAGLRRERSLTVEP